jgi:phosphatidylglycerophosphatase A
LRLIKNKQPINEYYKVPFIVNLIGSVFFVGHIPFASGTFGSLVALGVYLGFHRYMLHGMVSEYYILSGLIVVFFAIGVFVSEIMRKRYGEDPPEVVIDEVVGQWVTYLVGAFFLEMFFKAKTFDPAYILTTKVAFGVIGFLLFRFFDIIKLQPAKYYDTQNSGFAIMIDDVVAGIYAGICAAPVTHFLWYRFLIKFFFK